jgi:hypothetical protein
MAIVSYLLPIGSAILPITGSSFTPATKALDQGTNFDWAQLEFPDTAATRFSSFFVFPVPTNYAGGSRQVRIRWITPSADVISPLEWHGQFGLKKQDGSVWDTPLGAVDSNNDISIGADTTNEVFLTITSAAWVPGDFAVLHLYRDPGVGADILAATANITEVAILVDVPVTATIVDVYTVDPLSVGISFGDPLYITPAATVDLADATVIGTARVIGIANAAALPGAPVTVLSANQLMPGVNAGPLWVPGISVFLTVQPAPSPYSQIPPAVVGEVVQRIGVAASPVDLTLLIGDPVIL